MPLFMFLSGYVFYWSCRKKCLFQVLISRLRGIGIPMLVWGSIEFILSGNLGVNECSLLYFVKSVVNHSLSIWFLWAVLISSVLVAVIYKSRIRLNAVKYTLMVLAVVLVAILPGQNENLYVYPYFIIGFAFSEYRVFYLEKFKKLEFVFLLLWICLIPFYQKEHYIYMSGIMPFGSKYGFWKHVGIDAYRYAIGLFGVFAVVYVGRILYHWVKDRKIAETVIYGGKHSLDIYVMQRLLLELAVAKVCSKMVCVVGFNYLTSNLWLFDLFIAPVCALACFAVLSFVAKQIEKSGLLSFVLFGKRV